MFSSQPSDAHVVEPVADLYTVHRLFHHTTTASRLCKATCLSALKEASDAVDACCEFSFYWAHGTRSAGYDGFLELDMPEKSFLGKCVLH